MRGLDPYAAPIVGTANVIMQGLGAIEDRKHREEDRAWNRQVQERQQQEWQAQDEFNEIITQAMQGGEPPAEEQPLPNMQQGLGVAPNQTPVSSPGLQQGLSRQSPVQQKQSPDSQDIFSKAPYFTQKKGALSDMDLSKYSPAAIAKAQEYFIDFETKQMRHSEAGLRLLQSQAEEHRRQGLQKVSQALTAYQQGNIEQSVSLLKEAHDMDIPNGRTTTINPDGNVIARNFVTGEQGELGLNVNDPKQIENTIKQMSQYFQSPEQFVNDYFLNSETQLEAKKEALLNPKVMVDNRGTVLYRVDIPNSDTGQVDTLFFDHLPTFGSDPLQVEGSQLQGFQEVGAAKDLANILDKRDQTVNRQAKRAGGGLGIDPRTLKTSESKHILELMQNAMWSVGATKGDTLKLTERAESLYSQGMDANAAVYQTIKEHIGDSESNINAGPSEKTKGQRVETALRGLARMLRLPVQSYKEAYPERFTRGLGFDVDDQIDTQEGQAGRPQVRRPIQRPAQVKQFSMPPNARQAPDGKWYVPDPDRPGKYLEVR